MGRKQVLIEGFKLVEGKRDGCFRYSLELCKGLVRLHKEQPFEFEIEALIGGKTMALADVVETLDVLARSYRRKRAAVDEAVRFRQRLADAISSTTPLLSEPLKKIDKRLNLTRNLERAHIGAPVRTPQDPKRYDLIHLTLPSSFKLIQHLESACHLMTVHDCTHRLFPEFHTRQNVDAAEQGLQFSLNQRAAFIAVSQSARSDLMKLYGVEPERITTIYEGSDTSIFYPVSDQIRINQLREEYGIAEGAPYLLTLSTLEPRKNLRNTLKAFSQLLRELPDSPLQFVIAGGLGWKYDQFLSEMERSRERVIFTDFVPDEDLAALYSGALAFSFVSHYEGFGLPALEAMTCGVPVVYGNRGALPEVVGEAGLAADPNDVDQISRCFAALIQNPELRSEMSCRAVKRAAEFSWDTTVRSTVEVYRSLLAGKPPSAVKSTQAPGETTFRPENS